MDQDTLETTDVLSNDIDSDGSLDTSTVTIVSEPSQGVATVKSTGEITYTPNDGFIGTDSYTYTVSDNDGEVSNEATVTITVNEVVAPPEPTGEVDFAFAPTNDWGSGFCGEFTITNNTDTAITNWELSFDWDKTITNLYTTDLVSHTGDSYVISCLEWNNTINAGETGNVSNSPLNVVITGDNFSYSVDSSSQESTEETILTQAITPIESLANNVESTDEEVGDLVFSFSPTNDWDSGFCGEFNITNNGDDAITNWELSFDWDKTITNLYTTDLVSHTGDSYVISCLEWNNTINAGETMVLGFQGETGNVSNSPLNVVITGDDFYYSFDEPTQGNPTEPEDPTEPDDTIDPALLPTNDDWLNQIVDKDGNAVWLTGANWFGYNTGTNTFDGIWSASLEDTIKEMANRGINLLRIPISTELLDEWSNGIYPEANFNTYTNANLIELNSLEIFDLAVDYCKQYGMKIMLDVHSADTNAMGHIEPLWYSDSISTDTFYSAWEWVADRYKNDDTIVAFDLENEPHGLSYSSDEAAIWDNSNSQNNWKVVAQTCANKILAINPNVLIMVEGIESYPKEGKDYSSTDKNDFYTNWWGGNLRGVADYPLDLGANQDQLVYSPHDYGPAVFEQPWFYDGFTKESVYEDCWKDNWAYIMEEDIAPLLIGEWGGFMDGGSNEAWLNALQQYIIENHINHTFWCFNANSGDTGGLVLSDFTTWDEEKYALLEPALWQDNDGKFISLDHENVLGEDGTNVSQYYEAS